MAASNRLNVLLINEDEDDVFILYEVSQNFSDKIDLNYVSTDGNVLNKITSATLPDIIILDLHISKVDGLLLLKQLKTSKILKDIPVIIYSSRQQSSVVKKCFDLDATLFVEKPHTYKGIERMVRKILEMEWAKTKIKRREHNFILEMGD